MTTPEHLSTGTRPAGTDDEQGAAKAVREMFDQIAPRYDLLNHVLSLNIDRLWWWRSARRFRPVLLRPDAWILDICCGTGQMTMALLRRRPKDGRPILAADFSHRMLLRGAAKLASLGAIPFEADALHLPLPSSSIDLITTAFGFRNLANYREGLEEFHRVLKPRGNSGSWTSASRAVLWESSTPFISAACCLRSDPSSPEFQELTNTFPAPFNGFPLRRRCS